MQELSMRDTFQKLNLVSSVKNSHLYKSFLGTIHANLYTLYYLAKKEWIIFFFSLSIYVWYNIKLNAPVTISSLLDKGLFCLLS